MTRLAADVIAGEMTGGLIQESNELATRLVFLIQEACRGPLTAPQGD